MKSEAIGIDMQAYKKQLKGISVRIWKLYITSITWDKK